MNVETLNKSISKYLDKLQIPNSNINEYRLTVLSEIKKSSQLTHLISICKLFENDEQRKRRRREKEKNGTLNHGQLKMNYYNSMNGYDLYYFHFKNEFIY